MTIEQKIQNYIESQPELKRHEMILLNDLILKINPSCKLWFLDGKNREGKIVSNPNIGYGKFQMNYTNGNTKEFYQIGLSANTTGISIYIMGLKDKLFLAKTFGNKLGKASVTGYCIKFKSLKDINLNSLQEAIQVAFETGTF